MKLVILSGITVLLVLAPCSLAIRPSIYFTTAERGLSAFSLETNQVKKIVNGDDHLYGIAYDSMKGKLYWTSLWKIYRSNKDGSGAKTVFSQVTSEYGTFYGLAFDWITGNIYVITYDGFILACSSLDPLGFSCYTIRDGPVSGAYSIIALDPTEGLMYWTAYLEGTIHRSEMGGSNSITLVNGLDYPRTVTIDFAHRDKEYISHNYGAPCGSTNKQDK